MMKYVVRRSAVSLIVRVRRALPLLASLCLLAFSCDNFAGEGAYTPKADTPERQAICDGMRHYVLETERPAALPQPIVFKIEYLKVMGKFAGFEGVALFQDGSFAAGVALPDVVYTTFLQRGADGTWAVIADLTRTDVPDQKELRQIRKRFPSRIPTEIIPEFWRDRLR